MVYRILVTDGPNKNTLAILRTIGKKNNISITSNKPKIITLGSYSKYCRKTYVLKSKMEDIDSYANELLAILRNDSYDVLLPVGLNSYIAVSKNKAKFEQLTKIVIPEWEKMKIAYNKDSTIAYSDEIGIPTPKTYALHNEDDINNINDFPVVAKSTNDTGGFIKYCNNKHDLKKILNILRLNPQTDIIVQEYIQGFGCGFYGVYKNGEMIAYFLHKRIKEFPITGGPSAVAESFFDERLYEYGKKVCDGLQWHGPIMVEFKFDIKNDDFKLIEINPKLWGSLDLTIEAGVNVPEILVNLALNQEIFAISKYKFIKYKWMFPDEFKVLLSEFSLKNIINFLRVDKNTKTNFDLNDPLPTFVQIGRTFIECPLILFSSAKKYPHGKVS